MFDVLDKNVYGMQLVMRKMRVTFILWNWIKGPVTAKKANGIIKKTFHLKHTLTIEFKIQSKKV